MAKGLAAKVKEHNAKSKYKVTTSMLQSVYNRGVGAYKTNPSSVRPNVSSPEQWAMARVNSFLKIVAGSKSANHDKDLLPAAHPSSTKKMDDGYYVDKADKPLNKPFRLPAGSSKKFGVYVKDGDKIKKVTFGDPNMEIRRDDPKARANFRSRHSCDTATDKTSARYWSCRMWSGATVGSITKDIEGKILKADEEQRMVYGWASVVTEKGEAVVDRQGDVIEPETLVRAVNKFMEHVPVRSLVCMSKMVTKLRKLPSGTLIWKFVGMIQKQEPISALGIPVIQQQTRLPLGTGLAECGVELPWEA